MPGIISTPQPFICSRISEASSLCPAVKSGVSGKEHSDPSVLRVPLRIQKQSLSDGIPPASASSSSLRPRQIPACAVPPITAVAGADTLLRLHGHSIFCSHSDPHKEDHTRSFSHILISSRRHHPARFNSIVFELPIKTVVNMSVCVVFSRSRVRIS